MGSNATDEDRCFFQPFTITTVAIENGQTTKLTELNNESIGNDEKVRSTQPNVAFEEHAILPHGLQNELPLHLQSVPLEEIDQFYGNKETFIAVNGNKQIFRFSSSNAFWLFDPFSPIRRTSLSIMIHRYFAWFIIATVLVNCWCLLKNSTSLCELQFEPIFLAIYLLEFFIKIIARGLVLAPFTYLRDPWNWLDLFLIVVAVIAAPSSINAAFSNVWRFPILAELRILKIVPNSIALRKTAKLITDSVRKLQPVLVFIIFTLCFTSVICLLIYMGVLTQTCVYTPATSVQNWHEAVHDSTQFRLDNNGNPIFCGNASGAIACPEKYTCLQGIRSNPDYGYTNFDTFGFSFLSVFRATLRDFWEDLLFEILATSGPWHILTFVWFIFFCSFFLLSLIWGQIAHSYNKLKQDRWESDLVKDLREKDTVRANVQTNAQQDGCCTKLQKKLFTIVYDPFAVLFVIICILLNTLALALDHHDMDRDLERVLWTANWFFLAVFTVEAVLKNLALGPIRYFSDTWNLFDFVVVAFGLIELALEGVYGLSLLRVFRLFRPLRLGKVLPSFDLILHRIHLLISRLFTQSVFICISIFIFTIFGTRRFAAGYIERANSFPDGQIPRWNFTDPLHSFMVVFRALCGEAIETMFECLHAKGPECLFYYFALILIGNFAVSHLFVALLFDSDDTKALPTTEKKIISEKSNKKFQLRSFLKDKLVEPNYKDFQDIVKVADEENGGNSGAATLVIQTDTEDDNGENATEQTKCCPQFCYDKIHIFKSCDENDRCRNIRVKLRKLTKNNFYTATISIVILVACLSLVLRWDVESLSRQHVRNTLLYIDIVFAILLSVECLIKLVSLGLKSYFRSIWCAIDLINTIITILSLFPTAPVFKILVALRPLSIISRCKTLKVTAIALTKQFSTIFNVIVVCAAFWLIFAIMGVQLFAGKFYKCVDSRGHLYSYEIVPNISTCHQINQTVSNSDVNFDNVFNSYFSLLQVATFKGWIRIIKDATDARNIDSQPIRESSIESIWFFVIFIVLGVFICMNVVIGVLVAYIKRLGSPAETFMTNEQIRTVKDVEAKANAVELQDVPNNMSSSRANVYNLVKSKKFDIIAFGLLIAYIASLSLDHYNAAYNVEKVLTYSTLLFTILYLIETSLRLYGLRGQFVQSCWNIYDFFVCVLCVLEFASAELIGKYFISTILLRIIRVFRFKNLCMKSSSGLSLISNCWTRSWRALYNLSTLLFLVTYIYAVFGMALFGSLELVSPTITQVINFKTFGRSLIVLFQVMTGAGWDGIIASLERTTECENNLADCKKSAAIFYMLSYLFITFTIILNYNLIIILEYYYQASAADQDSRTLKQEDVDEFDRAWNNIDTESTKFIPKDKLSDLLDSLQSKLRKAKPNENIIRRLGLPVHRDQSVHYGQVLVALSRNNDVYSDKKFTENLTEITNGK